MRSLEQVDTLRDQVDAVEAISAEFVPTSTFPAVLDRDCRAHDDACHNERCNSAKSDVHPRLHAGQRTGRSS